MEIDTIMKQEALYAKDNDSTVKIDNIKIQNIDEKTGVVRLWAKIEDQHFELPLTFLKINAPSWANNVIWVSENSSCLRFHEYSEC